MSVRCGGCLVIDDKLFSSYVEAYMNNEGTNLKDLKGVLSIPEIKEYLDKEQFGKVYDKISQATHNVFLLLSFTVLMVYSDVDFLKSFEVIPKEMFEYFGWIKEIHIPDNIKEIEDYSLATLSDDLKVFISKDIHIQPQAFTPSEDGSWGDVNTTVITNNRRVQTTMLEIQDYLKEEAEENDIILPKLTVEMRK